MDDKMVQEFISLTCRLSPENLACDGEISITETRRRYRQIMKEWKVLEKQFGRKVTEDEASQWMIDEYNEEEIGQGNTWQERHGVNCYFCGILSDERECLNADEFNGNDGGSICPLCLKEKTDKVEEKK